MDLYRQPSCYRLDLHCSIYNVLDELSAALERVNITTLSEIATVAKLSFPSHVWLRRPSTKTLTTTVSYMTTPKMELTLTLRSFLERLLQNE